MTMTWANWISVVFPAVSLGVSVWLAFKLEKVKFKFRNAQEKLRAELRAQTAEIEALRSGAFVNFTARQTELGRRRLLAVERVWAEITELDKYKCLSAYAQSLNVDGILEATSRSAADRQKMSRLAAMLLGNLADQKTQPNEAIANKERPFVPELTFALFMAYRQILLWPYVLLQTLKVEGEVRLLNPSGLLDLARKALPHQGPFLDQHGASGLPFLVDELEAAVLASLREALEQKELDNAAVAQAKELIDAVAASGVKQQPVTFPDIGS